MYLKENYMLSKQRAAIATRISTSLYSKSPEPEYLFKGKGTHVKLIPPAVKNGTMEKTKALLL